MAEHSKAQEDALKLLDNPKVLAEYDDGSIDIEFEGSKLAMGPNGAVMTVAEYMSKVYRPWQGKKKEKPEKKKKEPSWTYASSYETPCERTPKLCEPRVIRHVAWDADDTIWDIKPYGIASNISGKLTLLDPDTVVEERPPYKPPAIQPTLLPYDEGLRYTYGYRYGSKLGYPEEEPEDFFLRQIDKDIEKKKSCSSSELPQASQDKLKELIKYEITNSKMGFDLLDVADIITAYCYERPPDDVLETITQLLVYEGSLGTNLSSGKQYWFAKSKENKEEGYDTEEQPSETALEVAQIMTELTEELTTEEKDKLGLVAQDVKLLPVSATPPKEPVKKAKTTYSEPGKIYIKLMPGYRDLLDKLKEQGVTNSIISLNTKGTVSRIIDKFGLTGHYLEIRDSWENKGKVFNEQMKTFGYKPQEAMFVDNAQSHVEDVAKSGAVPLVYGRDIKEVAQIVKYMTNA